jgi:Zn finger protein HypA/HybF involved in hydrogenase expression
MGTTARQVFRLTSQPSTWKIREFLIDVGRVESPRRLYVTTHGAKIYIEITDVGLKSLPHGWDFEGRILRFDESPEHEGFDFEFYCGSTPFASRFAILGIEMDDALKCECCNDGTIYKVSDNRYRCPNCHHTRVPIQLGDKPSVHGTYPPHCTGCGLKMQWAGNVMHCSSCGSTNV